MSDHPPTEAEVQELLKPGERGSFAGCPCGADFNFTCVCSAEAREKHKRMVALAESWLRLRKALQTVGCIGTMDGWICQQWRDTGSATFQPCIVCAALADTEGSDE